MSARVEYFPDDAGEHRYRVVAGNNQKLATSEGYTRPEDAERGFGDLVSVVELISAQSKLRAYLELLEGHAPAEVLDVVREGLESGDLEVARARLQAFRGELGADQ
jgi:uncharacterized protein YegP (UPF0339 family)